MDEKMVKSAAAGAIGGAVVCAVGIPASVFAVGIGAIGYTAYRLLTNSQDSEPEEGPEPAQE